MTRVLLAPDVLTCVQKLNDATRWLAMVRADVGAGHALRIEWISEDIAHVRSELLRASVGDVDVEPLPGAEEV